LKIKKIGRSASKHRSGGGSETIITNPNRIIV